MNTLYMKNLFAEYRYLFCHVKGNQIGAIGLVTYKLYFTNRAK